MTEGSRNLRVGYFKIEEQKGSLKSVLDNLIQLKVSQRNINQAPYPVRIEALTSRMVDGHQFYEGEFVKIRMNNLPVKAAKSEGVSAIGLNSDEGIGEETAFLYSPTHKVLLLQQNQAGVSFTRVSEYFNHFGNGEDIVGISVMMKLDAFERFKKAQRIQSVSIGLVSVAGVEDYRDSGMSVSHAIDAMNQLGGQRINITVSVRQKDKSLSKGPVGKMISSLFGKHESDAARVTKLQLRADDEDGASMINFLRDRLVKAFNLYSSVEVG